MPNQIRITAGHVSVDAEFIDTNTSSVIWNTLPISASARTWGLPITELETTNKWWN